MAEVDYGVDPELVMEFVDESEELLGDVTNLFIALETNPDDRESIDKIFRTVHTIKGNSAFFNLMKVKSMAHVSEDLMNLVREGSLKFNNEISDVLIRGIDYLKTMLDNVRSANPEVDDENSYNKLLDEIASHVNVGKSQDPESIWKIINKDVGDFESKFKGDDPRLLDLWNRIVKSLQLVSPLSESSLVSQENQEGIPLGLDSNPKELIESILAVGFDDTLDDDQAKQIGLALHQLKDLVDENSVEKINSAINSYETTFPTDGFTGFLSDVIKDNLKDVELKVDEEKEEKKTGKKEESDTLKSDSKEDSSKSDKTMRVYESTVDGFLDFVGELVVVAEMYDHIQKRFLEEFGPKKTVADLKKNNELFNDLSSALQKAVLDIRRVSIKGLLQRAPRIIRDVATAKEKKIKVELKGEQCLIDKSLLESVEGPFVHMVRNAADHGVEKPQKRIDAGKPEVGIVLIEAEESEEAMFIRISDDGAGINRDIISKKAIENGLHTEQSVAGLTDQEVYMLLFAPGFSTAEEVTDISGRGVGMDVVKKNIEGIGGQIHIESQLGSGSVFTLEIPKTVCVKIMEGFLVLASENRFVLPMKDVGESFILTGQKISETPDNGKCILHHDNIMKLICLDEKLNLLPSGKENAEKVGVVVRTPSGDVVLLVDDVLGTQQVVVKEIDGLPGKSDLISGGVVLGDEKVAIVLNLEEF